MKLYQDVLAKKNKLAAKAAELDEKKKAFE